MNVLYIHIWLVLAIGDADELIKNNCMESHTIERESTVRHRVAIGLSVFF